MRPSPLEPKPLRGILQAVRIRWKVNLGMGDAEKVYGLIDEAVEQLRIFHSWLPPLPHVLEEAVFVCAVMQNLRVIDLLESA